MWKRGNARELTGTNRSFDLIALVAKATFQRSAIGDRRPEMNSGR
jgi:hypothetical protein